MTKPPPNDGDPAVLAVPPELPAPAPGIGSSMDVAEQPNSRPASAGTTDRMMDLRRRL